MYNNLFGNNNGSAIPGVGIAGDALGIYSGLRQGGVAGYGGAALNGIQLANNLGAGIGGASNVVPGLGAALGTYNFAKNWQSGNTGSDALNGAEAGAGIGSMFLPGIGTAVGALVGAGAGALSSAFGPGERDPEQGTFASYQQAFNQSGGQMNAGNVPPQAAYQALAGMFDTRQSYGNPLYNQFGRMGETSMLTSMTDQINSAIRSGKIASNASPQQIYSQVLTPWISGMPGGKQWLSSGNSSQEGGYGVVQNLLTTLAGQYQSGASKGWSGAGGGTVFLDPYGSNMSNAQFTTTYSDDAAAAQGAYANRNSGQIGKAGQIAGSATGRILGLSKADQQALSG